MPSAACATASAAKYAAKPTSGVASKEGKRYKIMPQGGSGAGLAEENGRPVLIAPAPCVWLISQLPHDLDGWLRIVLGGSGSPEVGVPPLCFDLAKPDLLLALTPAATMSGQCWKLTASEPECQ